MRIIFKISEYTKFIWKSYCNSWWLAFLVSLFVFIVFTFSFFWITGCIPIPWGLNSNALDHILASLSIPLLCLWGISIFGILVPAVSQKTFKKGLIVFSLFLISFLSIFPAIGVLFVLSMQGPALCPQTPKNRIYAIQLAQRWGGLASFPKSVKKVHTDITGGAFTRGVSITFEGEPNEIKNWLERSPGTKSIKPTVLENGNLQYDIEAREGATFAELILSFDRTKVEITAYWS